MHKPTVQLTYPCLIDEDRMQEDTPFVIKVVDTVEHPDGSATYSFDLDDEAEKSLVKLGLEFVLYCAAHELDIGYVLDNLKRLKSE